MHKLLIFMRRRPGMSPDVIADEAKLFDRAAARHHAVHDRETDLAAAA